MNLKNVVTGKRIIALDTNVCDCNSLKADLS